MSSVEFDDSRRSMVIVKVPPRELTPAEFDATLQTISTYNARARTGFVFDVRDSPPLNADRRRMIAERIDGDAKLHSRASPCAIVVSSAVFVGVARVLAWLTQTKRQTRTFSSIDEALDWLRVVLERVREVEGDGYAA